MFIPISLLLLLLALAIAPAYCSKHRVTSQGWNYPAPRGEDTMEREFTADLSTQLPYHPPPEGFRMSSDSSSDADSSMTSSTTTDERTNSIDRNRNITSAMESNANFNNAVKQLTTFNNNLNNRINNLVPNGILKKPPRAPHSTPVHRPSPKASEPDEVRNTYEPQILGVLEMAQALRFFWKNVGGNPSSRIHHHNCQYFVCNIEVLFLNFKLWLLYAFHNIQKSFIQVCLGKISLGIIHSSGWIMAKVWLLWIFIIETEKAFGRTWLHCRRCN